MKRKSFIMLSCSLMLMSSITLSGCTGLIKPSIGENSGGVDVAEDVGGEGAGQEAPGDNFEPPEGMEFMFGPAESQPRPEMAGNPVVTFYATTEVSSSQGGMQEVVAAVELFDTANADGYTGLIGVSVDASYTYSPCTWTKNEDGTYSVQVDEFTIYTTKEINGVQTFPGIMYSSGMTKGTIDIPEGEITYLPEPMPSSDPMGGPGTPGEMGSQKAPEGLENEPAPEGADVPDDMKEKEGE